MYFGHHKNIRGKRMESRYKYFLSGVQLETKLSVSGTLRPKPEPEALPCIGEYTGDAFGQPVITEENLFLHRVCRFYDCCLECIRFGIHGYHCQKSHAHGNIKIKCIDCLKFPYAEVFKLEHLLFAAEIFLNLPSGKIYAGHPDHIFL